MRVPDDVRTSVCFLGFTAEQGAVDSFRAIGTGFFVCREGVRYLVTAAHNAAKLVEVPFQIRLNTKDNSSVLMTMEPDVEPLHKWYLHDDPGVDVAAMIFHYEVSDINSRFDHASIPKIPTQSEWAERDLGPGDLCYAVGLFRLMQGTKRNLAIVHTGNIAAMPGDESVPVPNWRSGNGYVQSRVYLIEVANLSGLSGAPVFARSSYQVVSDVAEFDFTDGRLDIRRKYPQGLRSGGHGVNLLGVWSGSWDAPPAEVLAVERGTQVRVPVGMGFVVPGERITELLDCPDAKADREAFKKKYFCVEPSLDFGDPTNFWGL